MAKETAVTVWTKVQSTVEIEDTGNIITLLTMMYEYYVAKACKLYQQATENPEKRANIIKNADYYKQAAESVMAVINQ